MADGQADILTYFVGLRAHRPVWRGTLLLGLGLSPADRALALASLAAGAAGLFLEDDPTHLRAAQREGSVAMVVSTLAEAVRILKNEVRRGSAVSVALRMAPQTALEEMVQRGLQPDAIALTTKRPLSEQALLEHLRGRGATLLAGAGLALSGPVVDLESESAAAMGRHWCIAIDGAATLQQRRSQDAALLQAANIHVSIGEPMAALAVDWLRAAPLLQPRALTRSFLRKVSP